MEQSKLKRYNEIHIMLWEEVLKVFIARTNKIRGIEYYKVNRNQIKTLYVFSLKRKAIFNLFAGEKITEQEKKNLLMHCDCAACYIAYCKHNEEFLIGNVNRSNIRCEYCPIKKWRGEKMHCKDYHTVEDKIDNLINYIAKCISGKEKFNMDVYTKLRKVIMKKMYIVAHLEWRYE